MSGSVGTSGGRGLTFETRMCILLYIRGYTQGLKDFKLEYQVTEAEKFDDIVFDTGNESYHVIQLKHKEKSMKITHPHLFNEKFNTDYNLLKYVKSFIDLQSTNKFKDKIKAAVVYTNIDFDLQDDKLGLIVNQRPNAKIWFKDLTSLQLVPFMPANTIFDISSQFPNAKYYKFDNVPEIVGILKRQAVTLDNDVGIITEDKIRDALKHIIYAVRQPNDQELEKIIKKEIIEHFKLHTADYIYGLLENLIRNWCDTKEDQSQSAQNIPKQEFLTFAYVESFLQKHVKQIKFGITAPTAAFTGRTKELQEIKTKLEHNTNVIVTQSFKISGLGGVGKTQLTKQFVKEFGQSEFYGRVMWIEAESDESVKKSFQQLAQLINIRDTNVKDSKVLIDEVLKYFEGFKTLFVFDNYDKNSSTDESLVVYCQKKVSGLAKEFRPFFLYTSRNQKNLPGVPLLNLDVLSPEDAVKLIENELAEISHKKDEAEELASMLHYFPLALRQANAYIIEQHKIKKVFRDTYCIKNFIAKYDEEDEKLLVLDYEFPNDFGEYGKTTLITWNVTLDKINGEADGLKAIEILQIFAFLYADRISVEIFLPLFNNIKDNTARAILLLEKYSMITRTSDDSVFQIHRLVQLVVQIKFKHDQEKNIEQTMKLIDPDVYEQYFENEINEEEALKAIKKCTMDQFVHYSNLSNYVKTGMKIEPKFKMCFEDICDRFLLEAGLNDDVDQIKSLKTSDAGLKAFVHRHLKKLMSQPSNQVLKYFCEAKLLGLDDRIANESVVQIALRTDNLDMLKFLMQKRANINDIFGSVPAEYVFGIINGNNSITQYILTFKFETCPEILREIVFIATLFRQKKIIKFLSRRNISPNFKFEKWSSVLISLKFEYMNIFKTLLRACNHIELQKILFELWEWHECTKKQTFEIVLEEYHRKSGDINEKFQGGNTFLCHIASNLKLSFDNKEIICFLLDNEADPFLQNDRGENAFMNILKQWKTDDDKSKKYLNEIFEKIFFSQLTPDKFVSVIVRGLFRIDKWTDYEILNKIFEKLLQAIGDMNAKNYMGENVLINYVRDVNCDVENVKILVENGMNVNIKDKKEKSALQYCVELNLHHVIKYLLNKVDKYEYETIILKATATLDAIETNETHGSDAIKLLQMCAYLHPDKIDSKVFLSLFDKNEEKIESILSLLENYRMINKEERNSYFQIHHFVQVVVQQKYKDNETTLLDQTMSLIYPELLRVYTNYFSTGTKQEKCQELMGKCTSEHIIHFKNLQLHINKHERMKEKYESFFQNLLLSFLLCAALENDVDKLKNSNVSHTDLEEHIKENLEEIIEIRSIKVIKFFIEHNYLAVNERVNTRDNTQMSLIQISIHKEKLDLFKFLVEKGADLSKVLKFASVDLIAEIRKEKSNSLQSLMKTQSDENYKVLEECLFYATLFNQESIIKMLIENKVKPRFKLKKWSLFLIGYEWRKENLKYLLFSLAKDREFSDKDLFEKIFSEYLEKSGDINDQDEKGYSLLCHATSSNLIGNLEIKKLEIINFLFEKGADATLLNKSNESPLSLTLQVFYNDGKNSLKLKELLNNMIFSNLTQSKFVYIIARAFQANWTTNQKLLEVFEQLIEQMGDINVRNEQGETVLISYVHHRRCDGVEDVKFLVKRGVDVDAINNEGKTALYYSVEKENNYVFEYLVQKVKSVDENILFNAIRNDKITIVKELFVKKFLPDHKFSDGKTSFEIAKKYVASCICLMKPQFIKYIAQGGDINQRDEAGNTLLIKLVQAIPFKGYDGDIDDIKFLVERGIDVNATNNSGASALYFTMALQKDDIFLYLVDKVSSIDENDLYFSINYNKVSIVKSLIPKHFRKDYRFINLKYSKKYNNVTPLEVAIGQRKKDVIKYLRTL